MNRRSRQRGRKPEYRDEVVKWLYFDVHTDPRGSLTEVFRFDQHSPFVARQLNLSISKATTLRGLHWHTQQTDYWIVADGMAQVVVSDYVEPGKELTFESRVLAPGLGVMIPPRRAHGFLAITDLILIYAVNRTYNHNSPDEWNMSATDFSEWLTDPADCIMSERDIRSIRGFTVPTRLIKSMGIYK